MFKPNYKTMYDKVIDDIHKMEDDKSLREQIEDAYQKEQDEEKDKDED